MDLVEEQLTQSKTIAVVGLSDNPERASYGVSRYMQQQGYRIIPVNPMITEALGEKVIPICDQYRTLSTWLIYFAGLNS